MKYLHYYEEESGFTQDYWGSSYFEPWVSYTDVSPVSHVDYNRGQPLTFSALQNGNIYVETLSGSGNLYLERDIKYVKNGQMNTISLNGNNKQSTIQVSAGDVLYFLGDNDRYCEYDETAETDVFVRIRAACNVNISGNILSLLNSRNWEEEKLDREYSFAYLFSGSSVVSAEDLILPDKLYSWCLSRLFMDCTELTNAPVLPSGNVEAGCYAWMFCGCTSLATAPTLPNIKIAKEHCYSYMFEGCVNLEYNIPASLPATEVSEYSYQGMFQGCKKIKVAPALPATAIAGFCYDMMFKDCTSLLTGPELPAQSTAFACYREMFAGCTALTGATETLPALVMEPSSYRGMFSGCTNLEYAPAILAEIGASTSWTMENLFNGCGKIESFICLLTDFIGAYAPTNNWMNGVAENGVFYKNPAADSSVISRWIPSGWTIEPYAG